MLQSFVIACCSALVSCTTLPDKPAAPVAPLAVEYSVPLLKLDGTVDHLTIEDNRPELGIKIIFCKELPRALVCLTDEGGKQGWLEVPVAQPPERGA